MRSMHCKLHAEFAVISERGSGLRWPKSPG
jgi:hypothetical protein